MLSIPGQPQFTCEGVSRREWLRVGGLGSLGVSLPDLLIGRALSSSPDRNQAASFGRAKSCIVLFMFGAPAHQDTWDLKPDAPAEVRGEFQPICSSVSGIHVSEHLPLLAERAHRFAQIRSVTHPDNTHTVAMHYMLTGVRHRRPKTNPQNAADDFPCFGAVVNHVQSRRHRSTTAGNRAKDSECLLPAAVSLNAPANQVSANNHIFPGFFAGFLGSGADPLFVSQRPDEPAFRPLPDVENLSNLVKRKQLLAHFENHAQHLQQSVAAQHLSGYYEQAFQLLTSKSARRAFAISHEPPQRRARYGMTPFGQGCLVARRLIEAGVSLVTVNWERDDAYWDTHADNFSRHKKQLLPNLDQGFSALLDDLDRRGLLDETLVVLLAEFGLTPKINSKAGRDHWAACNTVVLAGAGIAGGQVYGASDRSAAYPMRHPVTPEDLAATIYHLLGISTDTTLRTPEGQPLRLTSGESIRALL